MTVKQLIKQLEALNLPNMEVRIAQPSHDHWHSIVAGEVEDVIVLGVKNSAYHNADVIGDQEDPDDQEKEVVVLQ